MAIQQSNDRPLRELALFAGAGGGILGGVLLGWETVCAVERDAYAAQVLAQRQNDGILRPFPIWSDVQSFDGKPWRGIVDVISGGFPCQDISAAGRGAGIDGERSGMWKEFARIVGEVRPRFAYIENSPMLTIRGLDRVLCDLAAMGYDARWCVLSAADCGAPHERERIWILAYSNSERESQPERSEQEQRGWAINGSQEMADTSSQRQQRPGKSWFGSDPAEAGEGEADKAFAERVGHIWGIESRLGRVVNGVAHRSDRLKCIGNGQVPIVAATALRILSEGLC